MAKKKEIKVEATIISWQTINNADYISLSDMASEHGGIHRIQNWMRNRDTIDFLTAWEEIHNPDFNVVQMHNITKDAGRNRFIISPKQWIESTGAIGLISKAGRYGGIYRFKDIAYHFGMWLEPKFALLVIKEFDRLKTQEYSLQQQEWNANRFLTKRNYILQTDAIKHNLLPLSTEPPEKDWLTYASEADLLNMALFGTTAKSWRDHNPEEARKGENIRDHATNIQLIVLSNLEAINAELIKEGMPKNERYLRLAQAARDQLVIFYRDNRGLEY